jgi:hypothetical protein
VRTPNKTPRNCASNAAKAALLPISGEERGFELIGGKRIPFVRCQLDKDYWTTTYGSHDATDHALARAEKIGGKIKVVHGTTLLIRHERRGKSSWGPAWNGRQSISGKVANKLQGIIDTPEGDRLMSLVDHLRRFPFRIDNPPDRVDDDPFDYGPAWALLCYRIREGSEEEFNKIVGEYCSGWSLLCFIARDITGAHTRYTQILEKVIEAQSVRERETSIAARIIEALDVCANRFDRVPTKTEVRTEYFNRGGSYMTNSDFSKELAKAGLGWLPVKV